MAGGSPPVEEALESIALEAEGMGYHVEATGEGLLVRHPDIPLFLRISVSSGRCLVRLEVGEGLTEALEDIREMGESPREALEDALEDLERLSGIIERRLSGICSSIERDTRTGAMDAYDTLEELEE